MIEVFIGRRFASAISRKKDILSGCIYDRIQPHANIIKKNIITHSHNIWKRYTCKLASQKLNSIYLGPCLLSFWVSDIFLGQSQGLNRLSQKDSDRAWLFLYHQSQAWHRVWHQREAVLCRLHFEQEMKMLSLRRVTRYGEDVTFRSERHETLGFLQVWTRPDTTPSWSVTWTPIRTFTPTQCCLVSPLCILESLTEWRKKSLAWLHPQWRSSLSRSVRV